MSLEEKLKKLESEDSKKSKKFYFGCLAIILIISLSIVYFITSNALTNSANDDELTSSSSNSKVKSKKITFNQAEAFMLERCEKINQTLMKKKSVSFDGTKIYMFLSVAENGYVCISSISRNKFSIYKSRHNCIISIHKSIHFIEINPRKNICL